MHSISLEKIHPRIMALLEIILGGLIFFSFLWCVYPEYKSWKHLVFLLMLSGLLIYSKQRRNESWKDLGISIDNWVPALKNLLIITIPLMALFSVIWSQKFIVNPQCYKQGEFWLKLLIYPFWAFIQQYIALAFFFRRLNDVFPNYYFTAIFLSAILFSAAHLPNLPLVIFSFFGGLLWAWVYHKYNNLIVIVLVHAVMGTFLSSILMMNLTVGPLTDSFRWSKMTPVYYAIDQVYGKRASTEFYPIEIRKTENVIPVSGWIAGKNREVENVYIIMNGEETVCKYGIKRKDVAEYFGNRAYENSGFKVNVPIYNTTPGYYYLKLKVFLKGTRYAHYPAKKIWVKIKH